MPGIGDVVDEGGSRDITSHNRYHGVLTSHRENAMPNSSLSSLEMMPSVTDSGTRITAGSADPVTKGMEENGGVEPMTISEAVAENMRHLSAGGGIYIQKTVEVNYDK